MAKSLESSGLDETRCNNNKYCIAVDWLEVCCYGGSVVLDGFYFEGRHFEVVRVKKETKLFKEHYEVYHRGLLWANIQQSPKTTIMKRGLTLIKLANRVLYCEKYVPFLMHLIKVLGLTYKGLTRLDIAYDCNYFYGGRKPSRFVKDFATKRVDEIGGMYVPRVSEFDFHMKKSISHSGGINYVRIGAKGSKKIGYIYDKTLELQEVKDKPWIRDMWERAGLKNEVRCHVWRAEISIKAQGTDLLNLETGQLFALHPNYIATFENIEKIFRFYAQKVFDFRINEGQKNRRHFSSVVLFSQMGGITCLPKRVSINADSGRSERCCSNKLKKLSRTYVDLSESYRNHLAHAIQWVDNLSALKAARYAAECHKQYLDVFASCKFMAAEDFAYLEAVENLNQSKRWDDRVAEQLYLRYVNYVAAKDWCEAY